MAQIPDSALSGAGLRWMASGERRKVGGVKIRKEVNKQNLQGALDEVGYLYEGFESSMASGLGPIPAMLCSGVYGEEIRGMINNYDLMSAKQYVQELTLGVDPAGLQQPLIATGYKTWWTGPPSAKWSADRLVGAMRRGEASPVAMIKFEQLGGGTNLASSLGEFGADTLAKIPGVGEIMGLLKIAVSIPVIGDLIGLIASAVEAVGQFAADIICAATLGLFCL